MRTGLNAKLGNWLVVGVLMVLMSLASASDVQAQDLTNAEVYWLKHMREEEKLARDVYTVLYEKWHSRIFKNIYLSEQTHMDAIKTLLDRYGIPDPATGNDYGLFTEESELQGLYDEQINDGSFSLVDALNVGVFIEKTDIEDLNTAISVSTHKDIVTVYSNLLAGSNNHLEAFESNLARK